MTQHGNGKGRMIASVQRAIDILNLYDNRHYELGVTDIARSLDAPKSTISGLINTLEANKILEQNPITRKYHLGVKLVEYGSILLNQIDLRDMALPYLHDLLDWCNESVNLAVRDDSHVIYIERLFGTNLLGMRSEIGKREPIHTTALGKAILSRMNEGEMREVLSHADLTPKTPYTITDQKSLMENIRLCRQQGFSIDNEENELGGRCVAAPILDFRGDPVAALSISVPLQRMPEGDIQKFGNKVREVAMTISRRLGYLHHE